MKKGPIQAKVFKSPQKLTTQKLTLGQLLKGNSPNTRRKPSMCPKMPVVKNATPTECSFMSEEKAAASTQPDTLETETYQDDFTNIRNQVNGK